MANNSWVRPRLEPKKQPPTCKCSQCHMAMDKHLGELQKENNRENAPICVPCILGHTRLKKALGSKYKK